MAQNGRQLHEQQTHFLRKTVNYNDSGIAGGVQMPAALPAGARITAIRVYVDTAFNAGTTNNLLIGTTAGGNDVATTSDTAAGTAGYKSVTTGLTKTFAADSSIYVAYTQTGTPATAGAATIIIEFVPNIDG